MLIFVILIVGIILIKYSRFSRYLSRGLEIALLIALLMIMRGYMFNMDHVTFVNVIILKATATYILYLVLCYRKKN